ncbi:MarR family transcriptional regulator [Rhodovastum atsumiense]|nr:MarR family transcriptional regulator [Rhodovastum atsumiense]CAH2604107.1 MarR family transcriptional regulator [Rhodovastum atsumiense]
MATRRLGAIYDAPLTPLGINIAQFSLLRMIQRTQPVSLTELGRLAALDRSTVGRNVRVLARLGMVAQGPGKDQREAMITLSPRGIETLQAAAPLWQACQQAVEARLGEERIRALADILDAI